MCLLLQDVNEWHEFQGRSQKDATRSFDILAFALFAMLMSVKN